MNRSELLAQWAELAPGECILFSGPHNVEPEYMIKSSDVVCGQVLLTAHRSDSSAVLGAVIEAIRARGWHYSLFSGDNALEHTALTYTVDDLVPATRSSEKEPYDALLASYVAALRQFTPNTITRR